jgi:hypothetical protein
MISYFITFDMARPLLSDVWYILYGVYVLGLLSLTIGAFYAMREIGEVVRTTPDLRWQSDKSTKAILATLGFIALVIGLLIIYSYDSSGWQWWESALVVGIQAGLSALGALIAEANFLSGVPKGSLRVSKKR